MRRSGARRGAADGSRRAVQSARGRSGRGCVRRDLDVHLDVRQIADLHHRLGGVLVDRCPDVVEAGLGQGRMPVPVVRVPVVVPAVHGKDRVRLDMPGESHEDSVVLATVPKAGTGADDNDFGVLGGLVDLGRLCPPVGGCARRLQARCLFDAGESDANVVVRVLPEHLDCTVHFCPYVGRSLRMGSACGCRGDGHAATIVGQGGVDGRPTEGHEHGHEGHDHESEILHVVPLSRD